MIMFYLSFNALQLGCMEWLLILRSLHLLKYISIFVDPRRLQTSHSLQVEQCMMLNSNEWLVQKFQLKCDIENYFQIQIAFSNSLTVVAQINLICVFTWKNIAMQY